MIIGKNIRSVIQTFLPEQGNRETQPKQVRDQFSLIHNMNYFTLMKSVLKIQVNFLYPLPIFYWDVAPYSIIKYLLALVPHG